MSALASNPTISPTASALSAAAYLRIASLSIAAYDYIITLHAEYRMYKASDRRKLGLVLFILIRYLSLVTMVVSNVGFFSHSFTARICERYIRVYPVFKATQFFVSHIIMGVRTWNIAHRSTWVGRTISLAFFTAVAFESVAALAHRNSQMTNGNCMSGSTHPTAFFSVWLFYFAATLYDCLTISISTYYLLKLRRAEASAASGLVKILLYDGLMYFVAVAIVNIINIILYRGTDHAIQSSGTSLAYATTWIMSQRIILHTRGWSGSSARCSTTDAKFARYPALL
ncbi:hypothetical protein BGW80DRAFT_879721 [Lactifluus volemus]|nr:hypothetical protein BGW80DRAFT_879721 [Lactifluus volemus]